MEFFEKYNYRDPNSPKCDVPRVHNFNFQITCMKVYFQSVAAKIELMYLSLF